MWISGLKELKGLCQGCPIMPTQEFKQRRMLTGSGLFALLSRGFEQIFGQIVSIRMKTLSNRNMVASRLIKREKGSLPVDVRCSKTALLKLPNKVSFTLFAKLKQNHSFVSDKYVSQALNANNIKRYKQQK